MTTVSFREWMKTLVVESLHPELKDVITSTKHYASKQSLVAKKVRDLNKRGEKTGLEGNAPKGSSRMWMTHEAPEHVKIDGQHAHMKVGTKVAITAALDKHRDKSKHPDSLGVMQNRDENGDHHVNNHYRVLSEDHDHEHKPGDPSSPKKAFKTNEHGIFPPLMHHDHENHEWSEIGHSRDLKGDDFKRLTKCKTHPKGITHKDFCDALERRHNQNNGRHWEGSPAHEAHLDHVDEHPLVEKFHDYHGNYAAPPHDYRQKKNLGVWQHPVTGKEHIVARDHGFSHEVMGAYKDARMNMAKAHRGY